MPSIITARLDLHIPEMRAAILRSIADQTNDVERAVSEEVARVIDSGALEHHIQQAVEREFIKAVDGAVASAFSAWTRESPTVKGAIQAAITDALWKREEANAD